MNKIIIYGAGYVGLANGLLLARKNNVTIFDTNKEIIKNLSNRKVHIDDDGCQKEIWNTTAKFSLPSLDEVEKADYIILALPTDYNEEINSFNTSILDQVIDEIKDVAKKIIIKSTIPIGYSSFISQKFNLKNGQLIFSPEFLREGTSFKDASNPSRIIIGSNDKKIGNMFKEVSENNPEVIYMDPKEAEAVKLFANSYLAMRVAYVNELATFASENGLNKDNIIKGVSLDERIGRHYFRPSLGYGGYCLPKDSKQLNHEFEGKQVPSVMFEAIVKSNIIRKKYILDVIVKSGIKEIEIDGIGHKPGVSNFRNSPKLDLAIMLREKGIEVRIVDKSFKGKIIEGFEVKEKSSGKLKKVSDYI